MAGGTKVVHAPEQVTEEKTGLAPLYKVLIHNDPVTPMDFVVAILFAVFRKDEQEAIKLMFEAHERDVALVTVTHLEKAEALCGQAHSLARARKFPLSFSYEPEV